MSSVVADEATAVRRPKFRGIGARLRAVLSVLIAIVLALTPISAVLVLGWFMRVMRRETAIALSRYSAPQQSRSQALLELSSSAALSSHAPFPGWFRGVWLTFNSGLKGTFALAIATLPFGVLLLLSWWAGWENSFNKGYEQAWVGPLVALIGVILSVAILIHLPMALAHHASEGRIGAIWDLRRVRRLIARVRWRYTLLTLVTVSVAAPVYLAQIIPTFIENVFPHLASASAEELGAFAFQWHAAFTTYLIVVLLILRRWAARLYARAVLRNGIAGGFAGTVLEALRVPSPEASKRPGRMGAVITTVAMALAWFAAIAALFIAQFANHAWWNWVNIPLVSIPWVFRPY